MISTAQTSYMVKHDVCRTLCIFHLCVDFGKPVYQFERWFMISSLVPNQAEEGSPPLSWLLLDEDGPQTTCVGPT